MFESKVNFADTTAIATIAVRDIDQAKTFYEGVLGLHRIDSRPGLISYKSGGSTVLVYQSPSAGTNRATAATWATSDIEALVRDLKSRGVAFERYDDVPGLSMRGDIHVGDDMKMAWFKDPDGNVLSLVSV